MTSFLFIFTLKKHFFEIEIFIEFIFGILTPHSVKSVRIRGYSGPHFPAFQTEYGDKRNISSYSVRMRQNLEQKNPKNRHFSRSALTLSFPKNLLPHFLRQGLNLRHLVLFLTTDILVSCVKNKTFSFSYNWGFHWKYCLTCSLNPNLGGLFRGSFWGGGKITPPCLKVVRITLETWNLTLK